MTETTFGKLFDAERKRQGLSIAETADRMGYKHQSAVVNLLSRENPNMKTLKKSAESLNVPVSRLIPGEHNPIASEQTDQPMRSVRLPGSKSFLITLAVISALIFALGIYAVNVKNSVDRKAVDALFGMGAKFYPSDEAKMEPGKARKCFGELSETDQMQANINIFAYLEFVKLKRETDFPGLHYKWISTWYCGAWSDKREMVSIE